MSTAEPVIGNRIKPWEEVPCMIWAYMLSRAPVLEQRWNLLQLCLQPLQLGDRRFTKTVWMKPRWPPLNFQEECWRISKQVLERTSIILISYVRKEKLRYPLTRVMPGLEQLVHWERSITYIRYPGSRPD